MLRELHISNLAVIEDAAVELRGGLNCFTGQTGAGKSLVIGALQSLLGLRGGADLLRDGASEGRITGVFELTDPQHLARIVQLTDMPAEQDGRLIVARKLFSSGRTTFSINGSPATASMARDVGELLVDVHGQHDHQYLLKPANQLELLDRFAGCEELRHSFSRLHRQLTELRGKQQALRVSSELRRQQLELYEFQADEIDRVEPDADEYAELEARCKLLSNLEKVQRDASAAHSALYESEGAVLERLQAVVGLLRQLSELDGELSGVAESVRNAAAAVQDASFDLNRYLNRLELDPAELAETTERLNALNRLIHKYARGASIEQVVEHRQTLVAHVARLRGETTDLQSSDVELSRLHKELTELGRKLTAARTAAAAKLKPLVESELAELGMTGATFDVQFDRVADVEESTGSAGGFDAVEMLVQPNPGQSPRPLRKIASGGELSRIMLAVKTILAAADRTSVLVFDEIDANIGGRIASVIGSKLRQLAAHHQVLCITHLPQIAAYADHHLKISKSVAAGHTHTRVESLTDAPGRLQELAEMLAGKHQSDTTLKQAEELMALAQVSDKPPRKSPRRRVAVQG